MPMYTAHELKTGGPRANTPHSQCQGPGFDPWSGTSSHMPQPRVRMLQLKDPACCNEDPAQLAK